MQRGREGKSNGGDESSPVRVCERVKRVGVNRNDSQRGVRQGLRQRRGGKDGLKDDVGPEAELRTKQNSFPPPPLIAGMLALAAARLLITSSFSLSLLYACMQCLHFTIAQPPTSWS